MWGILMKFGGTYYYDYLIDFDCKYLGIIDYISCTILYLHIILEMYERVYINIVDNKGVCHLSNFNFRSFIMVSESAPT